MTAVAAGTRKYWIALAFPAAMVLLLFGDVIFGDGQTVVSKAGEDLSMQYVYWREFGFAELSKGNLALWNPNIFSGAPFFGGFQTSLLYPLNWIYLLLPTRIGLNVEVMIHVFLAGMWTSLWALERGRSRLGASLAAAVYMLSSPFFAHVFPGHLSNLDTMAWAPAIFLALDLIVARPTLGAALFGAAVVTLEILAGHPQYVYYTGVIAALYFLMQLPRASHRQRALAAALAMYGLAVALAAVQILAALDAAHESVRGGGAGYEFASSFAFPPTNLLTMISPLFFGGPVDRNYWGECNFWEMSFYVGVLTTVLMAIGSAVELKRRDFRSILPLLAALILAFGTRTPIYDLLYKWLPGFSMFRGVSKFIYLAAMFAALLAAVGFDRLAASPGKVHRVLGTASILTGACIWLAFREESSSQIALAALWPKVLAGLGRTATLVEQGMAVTPEFIDHSFQTASGSLMFAAAALLLFGAICVAASSAMHKSGGQKSPFRYLIAATVVLELLVTARLMRATQPYGELRASQQNIANFLGLYPPGVRYHLSSDPNLGMALSQGDIWGSDPMVTRRYAEFIALTQGKDPAVAGQDVEFNNLRHPLLKLLRFVPVFSLTSEPSSTTFKDVSGLMPQFHVVGRYQLAASRAEAFTLMNTPGFDPKKVAILESVPDPIPLPGGRARVEVGEFGTDFVDLKVNFEKPAILLMSDNYSTGWHVRSLPDDPDPTTYQVLPADYSLRGVPLDSGNHHLRLEYRPELFVIGKWISLVSVLLTSIFVLSMTAWRALQRRKLQDGSLGGIPVPSQMVPI